MKTESYYIPVNKTHKLHLKRYYQNAEGAPVFMLHGAIENGRIFYSNSHKGLAPFLAKHGYDVYVADLRGRGKSVPAIDKTAEYGQYEAITEDIPAFIKFISEKKPGQKQYWVAHSWGGVLMTAFFARYPERIKQVAACGYFACKRSVSVFNLEKLFKVDLVWRLLCPIITYFKGYLPARELKIGSDNETRKSHAESVPWVKHRYWRDPKDQFDYQAALKEISIPPTLYFAGIADKALGHPIDVQRLMAESGEHKQNYILLSKANGYGHDYNHIDILTHKSAREHQFQVLLDWFKQADCSK